MMLIQECTSQRMVEQQTEQQLFSIPTVVFLCVARCLCASCTCLLQVAQAQCGGCRPGAFAPSGASPTKAPLAKSGSSKWWRMGSRKSRCAATLP